MCGRFHLATPPEDVARLFGLESVPHYQPRYNIAPTQVVGVVRVGKDGREWAPMRWGLVPSWSKEPDTGGRMINARSESASGKPSFRAAFRRRRCLVPADGFYEWRAPDDGPKQPMEVRLADGSAFAMAGLWEHWEGEGGELETFTILTCDANEALRGIHDRMPVILERDQWETWLDPSIGEEKADRERLTSLLDPYPSEEIEAYPISTRVNSPKNDDPSLLERVDPPPTGLFS